MSAHPAAEQLDLFAELESLLRDPVAVAGIPARTLKTVRSYKFRIYPTKQQCAQLIDTLRLHRWLYNAALEQRITFWKQRRVDANGKQRGLTYFDQTSEVKLIKREIPEFAAVNSASLGLTLGRLDKAYKAFFSRGGFPKFKNCQAFRSISFQVGNGCKVGEKLYLHGIGEVECNWHRPLPVDSKPKQVVVRENASGKWYCCIQCEVLLNIPEAPSGDVVGLDLGLKSFAVLSDGTVIRAGKHLQKLARRLKIQQRTMARRKPLPGKRGSRRYQLAKQMVAKTHERVANARADFIHKASRLLVSKYSTIAVENLNVKGLSRGMLSKSVNDAAWASFLEKLTYKAEAAGVRLGFANPRNTSQDCSVCGATIKKSLAQRTHSCSKCGLVMDRDENAARNILQRAEFASAEVIAR